MSPIGLLIALVVVGVILALVPIDARIRTAVVVIAVVLALVALLRYLAVL